MNKVIITGNLTKDPELTITNSGISVCRLTVAVQRNFKNSEGEREADFLNVVVWRAQADNCNKFLKKGSKVGVSGSIQTRSYEGTDGVRKYFTEILADEVEFLSPKGGEVSDNTSGGDVANLDPITDDDLPF